MPFRSRVRRNGKAPVPAEGDSARSGKPYRVVVSLEHRFTRVGNEIYTDLAFDYTYWRAYLEVFDGVTVFARVAAADTPPPETTRADGEAVTFAGAPYYVGPRQFILTLLPLLQAARQVSRRGDAFILRSGNVSTALWLALETRRRPFAREVQGDIRAAIESFLGAERPSLAARSLARFLDSLNAIQVRRAIAVSYVSDTLRRRYPSSHPDREFVFSSVEIDSIPRRQPQLPPSPSQQYRVICVGRLSPEKGQEFLVRSVAHLRAAGHQVAADLVGPGPDLDRLQALAHELGISDSVRFLGAVDRGPALWQTLAEADLYVQPSLTEGMPRALIEAMAVGLPAVGTRVGGIPELLPSDRLAAAGSAESLADVIGAALSDRARLAADSSRNYELARGRYSGAATSAAMHRFWERVKAGP